MAAKKSYPQSWSVEQYEAEIQGLRSALVKSRSLAMECITQMAGTRAQSPEVKSMLLKIIVETEEALGA